MLILLCSYLLQELFAAVPGVSPWCWWDLGILEPSPHPQSWERPDGICRVRQDMKDKGGEHQEPAWPAAGLHGS